MFRPLPLPVAVALERSLAALLASSPEARARLAPLEGKVLRLRLRRPAVELVLAVVDARIELLRVFDETADLSVEGDPEALLSLREGNEALRDGRVRVEGEIALAQALRELVAAFDLDPEALAAPFVGGTLARRLGLVASAAGGWLGERRRRFAEDLGDYLEEETELLVPREEVTRFADEVDRLREACERLEARLARLGSRDGDGT